MRGIFAPTMSGRWLPWFRVFWLKWATPLLLFLFVIVAAFLALCRHATFHTYLFDLGYYTQVLWNTAHGNWFGTSLKAESYLGNHFNVASVLLTPLFWFAPDTRTLLFAEPILFIAAILPGYFLVRKKHPALAPLLTLAFVLNPLLHQLASEDLQGLMLSVPPLSLAFYAVHAKRMRLLVLAIVLSLLVREDMGIYIASLGLYILVFRPIPRRYGGLLIVTGIVWLVGLTTIIIPRLGNGAYPHVHVFDLGGSTPEIIWNILSNPLKFAQLILTPDKLGAFVRVMASMAGLPLIAAGQQLLWIPGIILFFASSDIFVSTLQHWWIAPLLPMFWGSIALTLKKLNARWATLACGLLILASLASSQQWSQFPLGGQFDAERYQSSPHDEAVRQALSTLPPNAAIAVTDRMGPHVSARANIYLYPWYNPADVDWIVVDENDPDPYPLTSEEMRVSVAKLQSDTQIRTVFERDGVFVFRPRLQAQAIHLGNWTWEPYLRLDGFDLAQSDKTGLFQSTVSVLKAGQKLRVALYWTALAKMPINFSVSVQLQTMDGMLIAQDDAWPARGTRSTEVWKPGQAIRDTHYLNLPTDWVIDKAKLVVLIYETDSGKRIVPTDGYTLTDLVWENSNPIR